MRRVIVTLGLCVLMWGLSPAAVISVDDDGPADFRRIQAGIDAAQPGDTVKVAPGTYREYVVMKAGVSLQGSGARSTVIEATRPIPVVRGAAHCRLDGFTIVGSIDDDIDGVYCQDVNDFIISNNVIKNCTWSGVDAVRSVIVVRQNVICGSRCAGVFVTYPAAGPSTIINNTFWNNANEADVTIWRGAVALVANNIMEDVDCDAESAAKIVYNDLVRQTVDANNLRVDPLFTDPNAGDFHLKSQAGRWDPVRALWIQDGVTSPCIDAGDPMSPIGWEPFPHGGVVNLGAYGGTAEASKSWFGGPVCETIIAGDINGDGKVDLADLLILIQHWSAKDDAVDPPKQGEAR
jgi:hypothetical protein